MAGLHRQPDDGGGWIQQGAKTHIAYVPNVAVARQVLAIIGLDETEIDDRIHFALTGEVLGS